MPDRVSPFNVELLTLVLPVCVGCLCDSFQSLIILHVVLSAPAVAAARLTLNATSALCSLNAPRPPALTLLRATVALQTAFCILAVDFSVFPVTAGKTDTFGYSLMDLGVGAIIFVGGLMRRGGCQTEARPIDAYSRGVVRVIQRHTLLVAAGIGRAVAVRATSYHVVDSEYGKDWNFFFTLALVALGVSLLEGRTSRAAAIRGASVLIVHQMGLLLGLTDYVLHTPRSASFLAANKEGVASLGGYLGLGPLIINEP